MRETDHDHIIACFDSPKPSFREEMYKEYKAHREKMPDELREQIPYIKELIKLCELPTLEIEGVEADDAIASFVISHNKNPDDEFYVVTGDKDMMQLVSPNVFIYDTMKDKKYDREGVFTKMGVYPENITDLLGLMGDDSDNIPGVSGVGPKTATKLIADFGSLENVLKNTADIKGKIGEKIAEQKDNALLSKELAILKKDIDVSHVLLHMPPPNVAKLNDFCTKLEFYSLKKEMSEMFGILPASTLEAPKKNISNIPTDITVQEITNEKDLEKILHTKDLTFLLENNNCVIGSKKSWHTLDISKFPECLPMLIDFLQTNKDFTTHSLKLALHELKSTTEAPQQSLF